MIFLSNGYLVVGDVIEDFAIGHLPFTDVFAIDIIFNLVIPILSATNISSRHQDAERYPCNKS